jgi:hypothetical protein
LNVVYAYTAYGDITDKTILGEPLQCFFGVYSVLHSFICLFTHPAIRGRTLLLWPSLTRLFGGRMMKERLTKVTPAGNVYDAYLKAQWLVGY